MNKQQLAQPGALTDPTPFVEYLTLVLHEGADSKEKVEYALGQISNVEKSIRQKDTTANLTVTTGFSLNAFHTLFPEKPMPKELKVFPEMKDADRHFPSTPGDIFFMIKSNRMDLNFQVAKHLNERFSKIANAIEDIQSFKYLDDRDMIDFVDGTENPHKQERIDSVVNMDTNYPGGSYLTVQKYVDRQQKWDALSTEEQEKVIGRTKMDDLELDAQVKPKTAHNAKTKVHIDGQEVKMLRQNRPFGNSIEHGTMFVGFAASPNIIETSLRQMIFADEQGFFDHLLNFVVAKTGTNYFVPPKAFMDDLSS